MPKGVYDRSHLLINVLERIERHMPEMRDGECWETTYRSHGRAGHILIRPNSEPTRNVYIHRLVWEAHNAEPIPEGMIIMHTCDNPRCVNPEHLQLGTMSDNTRDMWSKGRATITRCSTTGRWQ